MSTIYAPIKDGQVVETDSQNSLKKATAGEKNGMDKDAFLKLLVAQMQYQDPLEPTSNTEFVSQYAQFSQVEQMQNMASTTELSRATSLVGKEVYVKTTNSAGDPSYKFGKVDYVVLENGKAYLAIEESLYSLDDLDTVVDPEYKVAFDKATKFTQDLNQLPGTKRIDLSHGEKIDELEKIYNEMTDYEKTFIATDTVKRLNEYIERIKEVRKAAEELDKDETEDSEGVEGEGDGTGETEGVEGEGDGTGETEGGEGDGTGETEGTEGVEKP